MSVVFLAAHTLGPLAFATAWIGAVRWVALDARARLRNPSGARVAVIATAVVPFLGLVFWLCARPAETLLQRRERRLWTLLLEAELRHAAADEEMRRERRHERARPAVGEPKREVVGFDLAEHAAAF